MSNITSSLCSDVSVTEMFSKALSDELITSLLGKRMLKEALNPHYVVLTVWSSPIHTRELLDNLIAICGERIETTEEVNELTSECVQSVCIAADILENLWAHLSDCLKSIISLSSSNQHILSVDQNDDQSISSLLDNICQCILDIVIMVLCPWICMSVERDPSVVISLTGTKCLKKLLLNLHSFASQLGSGEKSFKKNLGAILDKNIPVHLVVRVLDVCISSQGSDGSTMTKSTDISSFLLEHTYIIHRLLRITARMLERFYTPPSSHLNDMKKIDKDDDAYADEDDELQLISHIALLGSLITSIPLSAEDCEGENENDGTLIYHLIERLMTSLISHLYVATTSYSEYKKDVFASTSNKGSTPTQLPFYIVTCGNEDDDVNRENFLKYVFEEKVSMCCPFILRALSTMVHVNVNDDSSSTAASKRNAEILRSVAATCLPITDEACLTVNDFPMELVGLSHLFKRLTMDAGSRDSSKGDNLAEAVIDLLASSSTSSYLFSLVLGYSIKTTEHDSLTPWVVAYILGVNLHKSINDKSPVTVKGILNMTSSSKGELKASALMMLTHIAGAQHPLAPGGREGHTKEAPIIYFTQQSFNDYIWPHRLSYDVYTRKALWECVTMMIKNPATRMVAIGSAASWYAAMGGGTQSSVGTEEVTVRRVQLCCMESLLKCADVRPFHGKIEMEYKKGLYGSGGSAHHLVATDIA